MFDKQLGSYKIEYSSANPQSKISKISFNWSCGLRLLQVFGQFGSQAKLMSLNKGVLSDMNIGSSHLAICCDKIGSEQLDLILNELEIIEPNFTSIKAELRTVIDEKNAQLNPFESAAPVSSSSSSSRNFGLNRADAEKIDSANATISHLIHSIFRRHGVDATPRESDFQKASRLYSAAQFEEALTSIRKFKTEELDSNPYGVTHPEKGPSVSVSIDTYRLLANCFRQLHRYSDALHTLDEMQGVLHNVLSPGSLQEIGRTYNAWKTEADEYADKQISSAVV